jgi:tetratricopeptide (TPR) repeat protein
MTACMTAKMDMPVMTASVSMTAPMPEMAATPAPTPQTPQAPQATPGLGAPERFRLALNLLQQGDSVRADVELKAYLMDVPTSVPAKNLILQIETPLEMLYPSDYFTVQLGQNETLSSISGTYLGDVLAFYGLARYNHIDNPARVVAGQMIRIPRTPATLAAQMARTSAPPNQQASVMPAPMPRATAPATPLPPAVTPPAPPPPRPAAPPAPPRDPWPGIRENVAAGRYDVAIRDAEASRVTPDRAQASVLATAYAGNAKAIRGSNATQAAAQALRAGQLYLDTANRPEDAVEPLELAVALSPMDMQAQTLLASAKTKAADIYYRNGVAAFQKQDLDGAIAAWDRALTFDPNHKNAQLQRAQAIELKQNLQRLRP